MTAIVAAIKAFFGEVFSDFKLVVIFALAAGLAFFALQSWRAGRAADKLETELSQKTQQLEVAQAEAAGLAKELKLNWQALQARDAERNRLAAENKALAAELKEVYENDPDAKNWADTLCPDGVLDCLLR